MQSKQQKRCYIASALATQVEASIESDRANREHLVRGMFDALFPGKFNSSAALRQQNISKRHRERVRMMRTGVLKLGIEAP